MFTVICDTREKKPLWDKDQSDFYVKSEKLDTGDITIEEIKDILVIERKNNVNELYANFTSDRIRFYKEIDRMQEYPLRFIIVESNWSEVINPFCYRTEKKRRANAAAIVRSSLFNLMIIHGINIMFVGDRGRFIVAHLLKKIYQYYKEGRICKKES